MKLQRPSITWKPFIAEGNNKVSSFQFKCYPCRTSTLHYFPKLRVGPTEGTHFRLTRLSVLSILSDYFSPNKDPSPRPHHDPDLRCSRGRHPSVVGMISGLLTTGPELRPAHSVRPTKISLGRSRSRVGDTNESVVLGGRGTRVWTTPKDVPSSSKPSLTERHVKPQISSPVGEFYLYPVTTPGGHL